MAAVAEALLELRLWRHRIARLAGVEDLDAVNRARLCVLCALHDLGKLTTTFQAKGRADLGVPPGGHVTAGIGALHDARLEAILAPLGTFGDAAFGLLVTGKSLNVFSMIGILLLMGIVKKNSILLVEYANKIGEQEGLGAAHAMRKAGPLRLRPILMTTVATMMSAVPPVLGLGPGTETRSPMAAAILGGLTVSTLLSLLVVPAFYVVVGGSKGRPRSQVEVPAEDSAELA